MWRKAARRLISLIAFFSLSVIDSHTSADTYVSLIGTGRPFARRLHGQSPSGPMQAHAPMLKRVREVHVIGDRHHSIIDVRGTPDFLMIELLSH